MPDDHVQCHDCKRIFSEDVMQAVKTATIHSTKSRDLYRYFCASCWNKLSAQSIDMIGGEVE